MDVESVTLMGIRGEVEFDVIVRHFLDLGGEVLLLDPMSVCGEKHILSAVMHAKRAFENGTNRSKNILTETVLYAAGERQIGKALEKMKPKPGSKEMVAVLFDIRDPKLDVLGMERCDGIIDVSSEKIEYMDLDVFEGISTEKAILERVASVDLMKF